MWLSWWWGLALLWKGESYFHSEWDISECQGLSLTLPVSSSSSLALLLAVRATTEPPSPYPACRRSWWNRSKAMWQKHAWLLLSCPVELLTWPGPRWGLSSLLTHTYQPIGIKQHSSILKMGTICTLFIHTVLKIRVRGADNSRNSFDYPWLFDALVDLHQLNNWWKSTYESKHLNRSLLLSAPRSSILTSNITHQSAY